MAKNTRSTATASTEDGGLKKWSIKSEDHKSLHEQMASSTKFRDMEPRHLIVALGFTEYDLGSFRCDVYKVRKDLKKNIKIQY